MCLLTKRSPFLLIGMVCFSYLVYSQGNEVAGAKSRTAFLKVGDSCPDVEITNLVNYNTNKIKISDFRGKLLILDFWATWCSPCIAAFPKLDSLKKMFEGNMEILSITEETQKTVEDFSSKMYKIRKMKIASVTDDKIFRRLFVHAFLPHYVWIDQAGKVIAITDRDEVNKEKINAVLKGQKVSFTLKNDNAVRLDNPPYLDPSLRVKKENEVELTEIDRSAKLFHSVLTKYIEGVPGVGSFRDSTYIGMINTIPVKLFSTALQGSSVDILSTQSVIVDIPDSAIYEKITAHHLDGTRINNSGPQSQAWLRENGYSYEIKTSPHMARQTKEIMLNDLNSYFGALYGVEGAMEQRNKDYLALRRTTEEDKFASKGNKPGTWADKLSLRIQNMDMGVLKTQLALPLQLYPPIIDETDYKGKIDIDIVCKLSDLAALNKELAKYGLVLEERTKMMTVPVIRMKKKANKPLY